MPKQNGMRYVIVMATHNGESFNAESLGEAREKAVKWLATQCPQTESRPVPRVDIYAQPDGWPMKLLEAHFCAPAVYRE